MYENVKKHLMINSEVEQIEYPTSDDFMFIFEFDNSETNVLRFYNWIFSQNGINKDKVIDKLFD